MLFQIGLHFVADFCVKWFFLQGYRVQVILIFKEFAPASLKFDIFDTKVDHNKVEFNTPVIRENKVINNR